jgi:hypothetical protein
MLEFIFEFLLEALGELILELICHGAYGFAEVVQDLFR